MQNFKDMVLLTKKQQQILLLMSKFPVNICMQKIYKSHNFYTAMGFLIKNGLVIKEKDFYKLSLKGEFIIFFLRD